MNILFLCTANIQRSRTTEDLFKTRYPLHTFRSAGLSKKECLRNNSTLCTDALLDWADKVYVFEQIHIDRIREHTGDVYVPKVQSLNIEDKYKYMQSELVSILERLEFNFSRFEG